MNRGRDNHLFSGNRWFDVQRSCEIKLNDEIKRFDGNRLLNTSPEDLVNYFEKSYCLDVPVLQEEGISISQREAQVDVSNRFDYNYGYRDQSGPTYVTGTAIDVSVPFSGDRQLFDVQPSTYNSAPPRADVQADHLHFSIINTQLNAEQVRSTIERTLADIKQYLEWLRSNAATWNGRIRNLAQGSIEARRQKLLADQNLVASIGFPLKPRADAPRTYAAPEVRRKIAPTLPQATTAPYRPEPTLTSNDYEHILSILNNMVHVMERSPSAFIAMDEEALRTHFLVQLNGQYEGQATGETFNYEGKTDILLRLNGKNIFIAECKFWGGPKKLTETLTQLLGYTSWRDTKVAVILFNRNKNFSQVLGVIPETVKAHQNFKRDLAYPSETSFRYIFSHRDDPNRELTLTVMVFDVPITAGV